MSHETQPQLPHMPCLKTTWGIVLKMGNSESELGKITSSVLVSLFGHLTLAPNDVGGHAVINGSQEELTVRLYDEVLWPLTRGEIDDENVISVSNLFAAFDSVFDMGELEAIETGIHPQGAIDRVLIVRALLNEVGSENIREVVITKTVDGAVGQDATYRFGRLWGGRDAPDTTRLLCERVNDAKVLITAIPDMMRIAIAPVLRGVFRPELRLAIRNELARALLSPAYEEVLGLKGAVGAEEYDTVTALLESGHYQFVTMADSMVSLLKDQRDPSGIALLRIQQQGDLIALECLNGRPWDSSTSWHTLWWWAAYHGDMQAEQMARNRCPKRHLISKATLAVYDYIARCTWGVFLDAGHDAAELKRGFFTRLQTAGQDPVVIVPGGLIQAGAEPPLEVSWLQIDANVSQNDTSDYLAQTDSTDTHLPLGVYVNDGHGLVLAEHWVGAILLHALKGYQEQTAGAPIPKRFNLQSQGGGGRVTLLKEGPFYIVRGARSGPLAAGTVLQVLGEFTRHAPVYEVEQTNARLM